MLYDTLPSHSVAMSYSPKSKSVISVIDGVVVFAAGKNHEAERYAIEWQKHLTGGLVEASI